MNTSVEPPSPTSVPPLVSARVKPAVSSSDTVTVTTVFESPSKLSSVRPVLMEKVTVGLCSPSSISSSTPVTTTVCGTFQLPLLKTTVDCESETSVASLLATSKTTFPNG